MNKVNRIFLILFIVSSIQVLGQESLLPLGSSKRILKLDVSTQSSRSLEESKPLTLPLIDDFSYDFSKPYGFAYPEEVFDTIVKVNYYIDTSKSLDTNELMYFSKDYLVRFPTCISDSLGVFFQLPLRNIDSSLMEDSIDFNGFRIISFEVSGAYDLDGNFQDSLTAHPGYYDSLLFSTNDFKDSVVDIEFISTQPNNFSYSTTLVDPDSNFNGIVYVDDVPVSSLKVGSVMINLILERVNHPRPVELKIMDTTVFSHNSYQMWKDNDVFVNRDFAILPPSIGVATFDGMDNMGNPYSSFTDEYGGADSLTSSEINLSNHNVEDSVIVAFFFQPQGLGDQPNDLDSLVLEFKDVNGNWNWVWSVAGSSLKEFEQVMIHIKDEKFFFDNFQLRWRNYATLGGQMDHWHLDFVRIYSDGKLSDSSFSDISFQNIPRVYFNEYALIPWSHYDSLDFSSGNMSIRFHSNARNENPYRLFYTIDNGVDAPYGPSSGTVALPNSLFSPTVKDIQVPNVFPYLPLRSGAEDTAIFTLKYSCTLEELATKDFHPGNDTVQLRMELTSSYAFDDGTAEMAYGVSSPVSGSKVAMEYDIIKTDTLRGFFIHWARKNADLTNESFHLMGWNALSENGEGDDDVMFSNEIDYLEYSDSFAGWVYYALDEPQLIEAGVHYFGWEQESLEKLNIGFDRNTNASDHLSFNTNGVWIGSSLEGSIMFRPVFGKEVPLSNRSKIINKFKLYPNPADDRVIIESDHRFLRVTLMDLQGRVISNFEPNTKNVTIYLQELKKGIYLINCLMEDGSSLVRKVFKR